MLPSGKYQVARPGHPSRQLTLAGINLGLASGEVMADDQYWIKGMSRWERVNDLPGVIIPTTPRTRAPMATAGASQPPMRGAETRSPTSSSIPNGNLSFWAKPEANVRLAVWSPLSYILLSVFFTPVVGSALILQNHRATEEIVWRGIAWFWLVVWSASLLVGFSLFFAAVPCGPVLYWMVGFGALAVAWVFTCALPHSGFLSARSFDAAWRTDWGKPLGFGFLGWVLVFTAYLLTR